MDKLIGIFAIGFIIVLVLYIITIVIYIGTLIAFIFLGAISVLTAKSNRALVQDEDTLTASASSLLWAGALTTGCIIGSVGLYELMRYIWGDSIDASFAREYGVSHSFLGSLLVLEKWILKDAYWFFIKVAGLLYVSNRVFWTRRSGGSIFMIVLPPTLGFILFFAYANWSDIYDILTDMSYRSLASIYSAFTDAIYLPIELTKKFLRNPEYMYTWSLQRVRDSQGSIFRLASLMPTIFFVIAGVFLLRSIFSRESAETI
jgi:hypothetical protein